MPPTLVPVSPLASVTVPPNCRSFPEPGAEIPEFAANPAVNRISPVIALETIKAGPLASPKADTAPSTVVVPAPMPAGRIKSWPPPARDPSNNAPPLEFKVTGPPESVVSSKVTPS